MAKNLKASDMSAEELLSNYKMAEILVENARNNYVLGDAEANSAKFALLNKVKEKLLREMESRINAII